MPWNNVATKIIKPILAWRSSKELHKKKNQYKHQEKYTYMHTSINIIEILQIDIFSGMKYKKLYTNMSHKTDNCPHLKYQIHRLELQSMWNVHLIWSKQKESTREESAMFTVESCRSITTCRPLSWLYQLYNLTPITVFILKIKFWSQVSHQRRD